MPLVDVVELFVNEKQQYIIYKNYINNILITVYILYRSTQTMPLYGRSRSQPVSRLNTKGPGGFGKAHLTTTSVPKLLTAWNLTESVRRLMRWSKWLTPD